MHRLTEEEGEESCGGGLSRDGWGKKKGRKPRLDNLVGRVQTGGGGWWLGSVSLRESFNAAG